MCKGNFIAPAHWLAVAFKTHVGGVSRWQFPWQLPAIRESEMQLRGNSQYFRITGKVCKKKGKKWRRMQEEWAGIAVTEYHKLAELCASRWLVLCNCEHWSSGCRTLQPTASRSCRCHIGALLCAAALLCFCLWGTQRKKLQFYKIFKEIWKQSRMSLIITRVLRYA